MSIDAARYRNVLLADRRLTLLEIQDGAPVDSMPLSDVQIDRMVARFATKRVLRKGRRRIRKAASVPPIKPRPRDAREYERALRRRVLRPMMRQVRSGLSEATAAAEAIERLDKVPLRMSRRDGLVAKEIAAHAKRLEGYHRRRLISTFRNALGVDIRPVLQEPEIRTLMNAWRRENISLIRTIPQRLHDGLYKAITREFAAKPFDQQALAKVINQQSGSTGYNLRRIARDQTNKAVAQLTRARHQQLGIEEFIWRTARDGRVRDSHAALEGTRHRYDDPPSEGLPGEPILCRCISQGIPPDDVFAPAGERISTLSPLARLVASAALVPDELVAVEA